MSKSHPLDTIIKELTRSEASSQNQIKSPSKKIVVINKKKKESIPKIPLIGGQNIIYYSVANNNDATNIAECRRLPVEITDFAQNRKFDVSVAYRVSCPAGNEEKVVLSLCGDDSLGVELDKKIKTWIAKFTDDQAAEFIDTYPSQVNKLQNYLKNVTHDEVGLRIDFRLSVDQNEQQLDEFGQEISVRVSDWDEELDLQFKIKLIIADRSKVKANLDDGWKLRLMTLTKEEIKKYLLKNITVSQFYYELKDTVRNGLVAHLNRVLSEKGWNVGYLYLDSKKVSSSPLPKELVEIQHTVNCTVQKYGKEVPVENTLQMIPQDVRRYISGQSPHLTNLEAWAKGKLERIIKPLLLDKKYADILEDFNHESEKIKQEMQSEAEAIGYAIKHIVSLPKLEHLSLKEKIEIKDEKAEFSTNEKGIKVELTTTASIKLKTFAKIEDDLNKTVDEIKELMRKTVHSITQEKLRTIAPERFYMRFYETTADEESVEKILKDSVKEALEDRFGATVSSVVPIPEETEIINYLQRLMGMIGSFETEIPSLTGGFPVKFQGDFKIIAIEKGSWYTFQSRFQSRQKSQLQLQQKLDVLQKHHFKMIEDDLGIETDEELEEIRQEINKIENEIFGLDDIKSSIEKSINTKLTTVDSEILRYTDIQQLSTMEKYINQWASQSVIEHHGLDIIISHFRRTRTEQEEHLFQAQQKLELEHINQTTAKLEAMGKQRQKLLEMSSRKDQAKYDELNQLYEQKAKLIADVDNDPEELKYLDEKIDQLENSMPKLSLEDAGSSLDLLQPKRNKSRGISQFEEQVSVPPSKTDSDSNDPW